MTPAPGPRGAAPPRLQCPSAQPDWKGAAVIGVVQGTPAAPRVAYLERALPVLDELMRQAAPVSPTEVFRIAAPCVSSGCRHFGGGACRLAEKTVRHLAAVVDELPACAIRESCRWFVQEGAAACLRCPQVVTDGASADPVLHLVTDPAR